jgi:hypothetical protein
MFADDTVYDTVMHFSDPARYCVTYSKLFFTYPVLQGLNDVRAKLSTALLFFLSQW